MKNRTIEFRGIATQSKEWVYGYYVQTPDGSCRIHYKPFDGCSTNTWHPVIPESVGQFTGLHDRAGKKIFEGDVVRDGHGEVGIVEMHNGSYKLKYGTKRLGFGSYAKQCEIIGNIFQPPNHG